MLVSDATLVKTPAEDIRRNFNFGEGLEVGETINVSPAPTVTATPAGLTLSDLVLSGAILQVRIRGGTAGVMYHLTATVTTTLSAQEQIRVLCGNLLVEAC